MTEHAQSRTSGFLRRWASWIVAGATILCAWSFVELSDELFTRGEHTARILAVDRSILLFQLSIRRPWLNAIAVDITALGSPVVAGLFTVGLGITLILAGDRRGAAVLAICSLSAAALSVVGKSFLARARPDIIPALIDVPGLSYPSGHALGSSAVYLTAAALVGRRFGRWTGRMGLIVFALLVVLAIGSSHIYLGVHYPSDVLAGTLLGAAWAMLMIGAIRRLDCGSGTRHRGGSESATTDSSFTSGNGRRHCTCFLRDSRIDPAGSEAIMIDKNRKPKKADDAPKLPHPHGSEEGAIAGEVVGAIVGSAAGPAGMVAGMVIGAAAGTLVGGVLDREAARAHKHDHELDEEIGLASGDLGIVRPPTEKK